MIKRISGIMFFIIVYSFFLIPAVFSSDDPIPFDPAVHYGPVTNPTFVFCADLDSDGDLDIVSANQYGNSVSILKNNGDGTFAPKVDYTVGVYPFSVFAKDLDNDGDADLVTANSSVSESISVLKNNGDGTFQAKVDYSTPYNPSSVFCADLDGDTYADIAVAHYGLWSSNVSMFKNNGDGTFQDKVEYYVGSRPWTVFAKDLDNDGDADLVTANYGSGNVSVLKNNGNGTFQTKVDYTAGDRPIGIFAVDLDADGDADLAATNAGSGNVSILKNNGDGTFSPKVDYPVGTSASGIFAADLDNDLDIDLAVAAQGRDNVAILKNNGNGTFQPQDVYPSGGWPQSIFCADLDSDGDIDLAAANWGTPDITVFKNLIGSLVSSWKFDEGSGLTAADSSGKNNDGTLFNGATWTTGITGKAITFDGVNDYVEVADSPSLDLSGPYTVMCWIYPRSLSSWYTSFINKYFNYVLQTVSVTGLRLAFDIAGGGAHAADSPVGTLALNQWQHVTGVWDGNTIRVYKNGVEVASSYQGNIIPQVQNNALHIGTNQAIDQFFDGLIDEVKIYNCVIPETEIKREYDRFGLAINVKFDEGYGIVASDSSGKVDSGRLINGATWADGKSGKALSLDGVDDYANFPDAPGLNINGPFTLVCWIYPKSLSGGHTSFINKYFNYILQTTSSGSGLRCAFDIAGGGAHSADSASGILPLNQWQHIAGVWDGNTIKVYKNGIQVGYSLQGNIIPQAQNVPLYIGTERAIAQFFNGLIDEVKIYRRALSVDEIKADCGEDCNIVIPPRPPRRWSCPYIYNWNGSEFVKDNDILPAGNPMYYHDFYKLMKPLVAKDGKYLINIVDSEDETSWIDMVKLIQVDHPKDVSIAPTPEGNILTYKIPVPALSAVDKHKKDQLAKVAYIESTEEQSFYGKKGEIMELNFGSLKTKDNGARLIMRTDLKCPWYENPMLNAVSVQSLHVFVLVNNKSWTEVGVVHPHQGWDEWAVAIPDKVLKKVKGDLKVKIEWTKDHRLDYVGLDTSKQEAVVVAELPLLKAAHSKDGDVLSFITTADKKPAVTVLDQQIDLEFATLSDPNQARSFVFESAGKYKANK